jgi:hypothetical protein
MRPSVKAREIESLARMEEVFLFVLRRYEKQASAIVDRLDAGARIKEPSAHAGTSSAHLRESEPVPELAMRAALLMMRIERHRNAAHQKAGSLRPPQARGIRPSAEGRRGRQCPPGVRQGPRQAKGGGR